jgi:GNAT superfamily N-acetyltransferase
MLDIRTLTGPALDAALDDVARLRIAVFRAFPYLYDGNLDYERTYLATYADSDAAILVGAFDGQNLVGAATGTPMEDHDEDFARALSGWDVPRGQVFYLAESVLLPQYRGQGVGHAFFDLREAHARALGKTQAAFCAVIRPRDHPARPADYRPLDAFWRNRGYAPLPGAVARFRWKDLGDAGETEKPLQFWTRTL